MDNGSTSSSLTSTSHTLTLLPTPTTVTMPANMPVLANGSPAPTDSRSLIALFETLNSGDISSAARHLFLQPPAFLPSASLQLVKDTLEGFAGTVSDQQLERLRAANKNKKRKRKSEEDGGGAMEVLKLRKVHVDGFKTDQVWQQAKRIIGSALEFADRAARELEEKHKHAVGKENSGQDAVASSESEDEEEPETGAGVTDEESGWEDEVEEESGLDSGNDDEGSLDNEHMNGESDGDDMEEDGLEDGLEDDKGHVQDGPKTHYVKDPFGLNDGFFDIDDFNRQSLWLEDQDARGYPDNDSASDEEIDWHADHLTPTTKKKKKNGRRPSKKHAEAKDVHEIDMHELEGNDDDNDDDDDDDDDYDDGPTFGDISPDAPDGASDDGVDGAESPDLSANNIYYKDFFAPPPKEATKNGAKAKKSVSFAAPSQPDEAELERAMSDVRRDLFDDVSDQEHSSDALLSDVSDGDPKSRRSNHERRQAKIADEIRRLESELVAKRAWTLSGEAAAPERPVNSLLEEDLDFEHAGKPVPVITAEVSGDIEAMIKRRILAQEFDEVIRRRPDADTVPASARRGLVALDDTKASKGLADVYEEEHVKAANPDSYVSRANEKLREEERVVEQLWSNVSAKLDALSSWHYRPKPAEASLAVVADVATVSMEDAQPATAQGVAGGVAGALAPQEIYRAGGDAEGERAAAGEVVLKGGAPVARHEMSREEKLRRRRREKERIRKSGKGAVVPKSRRDTVVADGSGDGGSSRSKFEKKTERETVADLKRGQVAVINRRGELVGVDGKKAKATKNPTGSRYKL